MLLYTVPSRTGADRSNETLLRLAGVKGVGGIKDATSTFERCTDLLLTFGYDTLALPYMYRAVDTGLQAIDVRTLTEAAECLGAGH
jgi:dihydrodipicolinate synthase/N-acetylneuraminate lyase